MKRFLLFLFLFVFLVEGQADPLRVFIRGGKKTHGPNAHEHERFLNDWKQLLTERGMKADGALDFPTAEQLAQTDVLVVHAQAAGNLTPEQRPLLEAFLKRGGGMVVIHAAAVADKPDTSPYWKSIIGGSWVQGVTKYKEGPMDLYFTENQYIGGGDPITRGAGNFQMDDEIYYDMDLSPDIKVLATTYTPKVKDGKKPVEGGKASIYDIQPQMWTYERTIEGGAQPYRAFVSIPGHLYPNFALPNYRAILLRGIAWAGKRTNLDEFTKPEEVAALTYPPGGPQRPADTLKALEVHPDFTMKLVASEPLINKPMNFDWDAKGRLWVAETPEYPNGLRGMRPDYRGQEWKDHGGIDPAPGEQERKGHDKISILTDTDGDGVMDKKEIFYEGLDLVTGLVFYQDGVIVTQAPDILWLRDTDGDGKADKVEKLYTGLGKGDTHAVINNPRWGWDGWIYATHGYSASSNVLNARGEAQGTIGSGVVRFRPDGSKIEQYSSKGGNTWGLTITADNRVMWTQPTSGTVLNYTLLPEYALARGKIGNTTSYHNIIASPKTFPAMSWDQQAYRQIDHVGDFTAAAGCAIYDGGTWPKEYNGDYFTTEPTINIIHHERLTAAGTSFTGSKLPGREDTEFIRSKDMWWRPIEVRIGPDGAMYCADFYNQAVIHNDTRGPDHNKVNAAVRPDRDHYYGRIWRIDHKDAKPLPVPDLSKADASALAKALESPNKSIRMTASRLLVEQAGLSKKEDTQQAIVGALNPILTGGDENSQIAALWTSWRVNAGFSPAVGSLMTKKFPAAVRVNALNVAEAQNLETPDRANHPIAILGDEDARVRLAALRAEAAAGTPDERATRTIIASWAKYDDDYQRSAAIGAVSKNAGIALTATLIDGDPSFKPLVAQLTQRLATAGDAAAISQLVADVSVSQDRSNDLRRTILDELGKSVKEAPAMTPELSAALTKLLSSAVSGSALPLAVKWDKGGTLMTAVDKVASDLFTKLANGGDAERVAAAQSLLGIRGSNKEVFPALEGLLGKPNFPADSKRQIIVAMAETGDAAASKSLVGIFPKLDGPAQIAAFDALLQRGDWANALLDAVQAKTIDLTVLGPANAYRLRSHPDKAVARRAAAMFDELNPLAKAKKDVIAKLAPVVEQKGNAANGKVLFTATCAVCHNFHGTGANIGPILTGMGAHGAGELLTAIVDPNAEVDPSFAAWNLETKNGQFYNGVIESENPTTITLKSLAGVQQVKVADLKSRVNTGRSLMPEGFEGLGGETIRDIVAYMQDADGGKFRTLDLRESFTASTGNGLYVSLEAKRDSLEFAKTGTVSVDGVPFNIVGPDKALTNILVLKGGPANSYSGKLPARVEIKGGNFKANRLHFLGGISGWGSKVPKDGPVVIKATVAYADGQKEELTMRDGVEFADYINVFDVPGSKATTGLVKSHQLRWFTKPLQRTGEIASLTLESLDAGSAPTIVAITAELADANAPLPANTTPASDTKAGINGGALKIEPSAPSAAKAGDDTGFKPQFSDEVPQPPATRPASGPRVLLVGGGSSHDFVKFFGASDKATLATTAGWVDFTQNLNGIAPILKNIDVLVISANQPISAATRQALIEYADAGGGIVALHPGTWYAWGNFPQWNKEIIGGGTKGHDALGPFTVKVTNPNHPVTKGVTASFNIVDELYNYNADPAATPIEVLAETTSAKSGKTFPQVFVVKHPKAKIVGITLGHDARAHDLPEYQTLLKNAVIWAGTR